MPDQLVDVLLLGRGRRPRRPAAADVRGTCTSPRSATSRRSSARASSRRGAPGAAATAAGRGNAQQAEQLAELQKQIINGTWKVVRRETGAKPTDKFADDARTLAGVAADRPSSRRRPCGEKLQDATSKANLDAGRRRHERGRPAAGRGRRPTNAPTASTPALAAEQAAYQALLKLRAREFEVVRGNRGSASRAAASRAAPGRSGSSSSSS